MSDPLSIETIAECPLELVFARAGDRWSHGFRMRLPAGADGSSQAIEIASSVEGTPEQDWPPSSPIQDVNKHGDYILLGIGMAGNSHWSTSCSVEPGVDELSKKDSAKENSDSIALLLDLACLCKDAAKKGTNELWIGSTYQLAPNVTASNNADESVALSIAGPDGAACSVVVLSSSASARAKISIEGDRLKIVPVEISESPVVATRWAFRLETR